MGEPLGLPPEPTPIVLCDADRCWREAAGLVQSRGLTKPLCLAHIMNRITVQQLRPRNQAAQDEVDSLAVKAMMELFGQLGLITRRGRVVSP